MYTLYTLPGSCSTGITALMSKMNLDFKVIHRNDVENYTDIVPTNKVPALEVNGNIITEGAAIALYLLNKHENDMLPKETEEKGAFLEALMFNYATLHPAYSSIFAARGIMEDSAVKTQTMQAFADKTSSLWKIVDAKLANQQYITGNTPNVVDYLAVIYTSWGNYFPELTIEFGDNVKRLVEDVNKLPEFQKAYALENAEFKAVA